MIQWKVKQYLQTMIDSLVGTATMKVKQEKKTYS